MHSYALASKSIHCFRGRRERTRAAKASRCLRRICTRWGSCSPFPMKKSIPTGEKSFAVGKSGQNGTLSLIFLGWVSCSLFPIKNNPNPRKTIRRGKKVAQDVTFNQLSWVGLALALGVRRFHNNIRAFSNPP